MYTFKSVEIPLRVAEDLAAYEHYGCIYAFGGGGFTQDYVILFADGRALLVPQEFLGAEHGEIGSSFNSNDPLVKEFLELQEKEVKKYLETLSD